MITLADTLYVEHIFLDLDLLPPDRILSTVEGSLKGDPRIRSWNDFLEGLHSKKPCVIDEKGIGICIPHTRTNHVSDMVVAAGRSKKGVLLEGIDTPIHYLFVIGVPVALASDYLRVIGALTRTLRSPEIESNLRLCKTPQEFLKILSSNEDSL